MIRREAVVPCFSLPEQEPETLDRAKALRPRLQTGAFFCGGGARGLRIMPRMLWIKAFHIVFVAGWFAGLFYLPRIFVNLAMTPADSHAERERLLLMAHRLHRFSTLLMLPALALGLWLWLGYGIGAGDGWLHAKLALVVAAIGYQHACGRLLRDFEQFANRRSERWLRVFNEAAVLVFTAIVVLVVVKPF